MLKQARKQAQKVEDIIARLSKQFAKSILESFITHPKYDEKLNADLDEQHKWCNALAKLISENNEGISCECATVASIQANLR